MNIYFRYFILFFLLESFTVLFINWLVPIQFEENDDFLMMLISLGYFSEFPEARLVFIHPIIGHGIIALNLLLKSQKMYVFVLLFFQILSCSILGLVLIDKVKNGNNILIFLFVLGLFVWFLLVFQFTRVASLLTLSGFILHYFYKNNLALTICSLILILLGSMVRFEASILISMSFIIIIFILKKDFIYVKNIIITCILIFSITYISNYLFYLDSFWSEYIEMNSLRGKVNDNPQFINFSQIDDIESEYNYVYLINSFFFVSDYFSVDLLKKINDKFVFQPNFQSFINIYVKYKLEIFILFLINIFLFFKGNINWTSFIELILFFIFLFLLISTFGTLKARVFNPLFVSAIFINICCYSICFNRFTVNMFLLVFIMFFVFKSFKRYEDRVISAQVFSQKLNSISSFNDFDFVLFGDPLEIKGYPLFSDLNFIYNNNFYFSGWLYGFPGTKNLVTDFKSISNKHLICNNSNASFIEMIDYPFEFCPILKSSKTSINIYYICSDS